MHFACTSGDASVLELLLAVEGGEELLLKGDKNGMTPAHCIEKSTFKCLIKTKKRMALLHARDFSGLTPLMTATKQGKASLMRLMLKTSEGKATLAGQDKEGQNALHHASNSSCHRGRKDAPEGEGPRGTHTPHAGS